MNVLAGDIGGTKTRLAVIEIDPDRARILAEHHFASRDAPGLIPFVRQFTAEARLPLERAGFGIAGPVIDGECRTPNLPWIVNARALERELGLAVLVLNDFAALGHGLARLGPGDLEVLQPGQPDPRGVIALIGAGTGLGQGFVIKDGAHTDVRASEGGHANFAPRDDTEWALERFLAARYGHVSCERVLSGRGLVDIYRFLAERAQADPLAAALQGPEDPAAVISRHALERSDTLCVRALDIFTSAYGAQAGNLALTVLATGGVYIAGGIAPQILTTLKAGPFLPAFRDKGRLSELAARFPVQVVTSPHAGLVGAAVAAAQS
jgi:glucokinase